jgi:phospholipase C
MPAQINHFFVLMMENRSLDHMLGFLKAPDYDIEGLDPAALPYNADSAGNNIYASDDARPTGDLAADPNHHFEDVTEQLYGTSQPVPGQQLNMSGFVKNYQTKSGSAALGANIMKCFNAQSLPVLSTLAKEYAVCDHWFASIPGPTLPNRLYVHCGTSRGRLDMAPEYYSGFYTVYEELAKHGVSSCIFWSDWSGTLTFSGLMQHQNVFYADYADFAAMCARPANEVPAYCFIEPRYNPADEPAGGVLPATDQHPDNDMRDGETLIRNVYNAIRQNDELWHSSVLLIVYDEHGGLYDHVPPVPMVSPDNLSSVAPAFDFKLSGVRVPAVVVSPYVARGTISKTVYDHSSVIATAMQLFTEDWPTDALHARAQQANTICDLLDLNAVPRDERPDFADPDYGVVLPRVEAAVFAQGSLSDLQKEHVDHAVSLNQSLPLTARVAMPQESITQGVQAAAFVRAVGDAAIAAHQSVKGAQA